MAIASTCLNCGADLIPQRNRAGLFYGCPSCGSRLVGLYLLRRLLPKPVGDRFWTSWRKTENPLSRPCPLCSKSMRQVPLESNLLLDVCTRCLMVWFDSEEFEDAPITPIPVDPEDPVDEKTRKEPVLDFQQPSDTKEVLLGILRLPIEDTNPAMTASLLKRALPAVVAALFYFYELYELLYPPSQAPMKNDFWLIFLIYLRAIFVVMVVPGMVIIKIFQYFGWSPGSENYSSDALQFYLYGRGVYYAIITIVIFRTLTEVILKFS